MLSVEEAAAYLGKKPAWIRRLAARPDGRLKAEKVGRDWVIKRADLERFAKIARKPGRPFKSARRKGRAARAKS